MSTASLALFCPYQVAWINDTAGTKLCEKSRRIGFSYADSYDSVETAVRGDCNVWYSSADLTAAREYMEYCADFARVFNAVAAAQEGEEDFDVEDEHGRIIDKRKIFTIRLVFNNGYKITAGSSNPNFFRSKGGKAKLDELAFHRAQRALYKAAHATARFWGYQLSGWSSHDGENSYFNSLLKSARAGKLRASVHRVTILDAVEQGIVERVIMRTKRLASPPAPDAKARQEWLDGLRADCPDEDIWREEYLCEPSSAHGSLMSYELIQGCEVDNLKVADAVANIKIVGRAYAGFDVARKHDLSVLWVWDKVGDVYWLRGLIRLKGVTYSAQEGMLNVLMANPLLQRLCIDATGIGNDLAERMVQRWNYRVEAVTFTPAVKQNLAMPLVRLFQDRRARIPGEDDLRESLHKVRKIVTEAGNIRLDAARDDDGHADEFWAAGLATHAADDTAIPLPAPELEVPRWAQ